MTNLYPAETGRIDRLPTWAQDVIRRLDGHLTSSIEECDRLFSFIGEPSAIGRDVVALRVPQRKYLHTEEGWNDGLRVRFDYGNLEVTGSGPLLIRAQASNVLWISEAHR